MSKAHGSPGYFQPRLRRHLGRPSASRSYAAVMLQASSWGKPACSHSSGTETKFPSTIRLAAIARHLVAGKKLGDYLIAEVTPDILGQWRDMRLKTVLGSTVNRDLNLISHVFTTARREWKWAAKSPTADVRRPKDPPPRDRLISQEEIDRICLALGYDGEITNTSSVVAAAFLFAIETGMRSGEILSLTPERITGSVAHLPRTKNDSKRDVALSKRALEILSELPAPSARETYFNVSDESRDALFRKTVTLAGIEDLTFHDSRHEAVTRLSKKLSILELARIIGHKDIRQLQVYYNETAAEIAKKTIGIYSYDSSTTPEPGSDIIFIYSSYATTT